MLDDFNEECKNCGYCCNTLDVLILKPGTEKPLEEIIYSDLDSTRNTSGCPWRTNNKCTSEICSLQKPNRKLTKSFRKLFIRWCIQAKVLRNSFKDENGNCRMKKMNIFIRDATEEDIPAIVNIYKSSFKEVADRFSLHGVPYYPVNFDEQKVSKEISTGKAAIVFDGCIPVATQTRQPKGKSCFLDHLSVIPQYQKKGISKLLFDYQHKKLKEEGFLYAEAYVIKDEYKGILEYYKKLGYETINELSVKTFPTKILHLRKEL